MASFNKFNQFVADLANGVHNFSSNQFAVALTDSAPVATNTVLANITQISYTNLSSRNLTVASSAQTSGTYNAILNNLTLSATGNVAQFRYVVVYDATAPSGNLVGWYDNGSEVNMTSGAEFVVQFDQTNGLFSLT